ncbi:integrase_H2C2 domain-containing protein [Trichonephila clavipes]|nr:integrase_H2C2 domain-containing protein [Trichonephila clavipes]
MVQRQNLRKRRITYWGCGGVGHLRSSCPRTNKEDHSIKCWGAVEPGILRVEKKCGVIDPIVHQVTTPSTSALYSWSDESVRKDQLADPETKPIIEFKESYDEKPSWQDITPFHPTTKRYWALWNSLHLRNGVLYRKWESDDGKTFK